MFRVLLTAYVSLVMLAGQLVCCCTTTRALADLLAGSSGQTNSDHERLACCCGHGGSQDGEDAATGQGCPSPVDEKHECPCHKNRSHVVAEVREQVADLSQVRSIVPAPLAATSSVTTDADVIVVGENAQVPNRASHFGTATELLRALRTWLI